MRHAIEEAAARNTRIKIRDGANLMLIVRPTGGSTWVFQYRHGGQRKPLTLGAWPDVSLRLARELAHDARVLLVRGIDPNVKKKEDRTRKEAAQAAATYTVLRLFEDWMAKRIVSEVYADNIRAAFMKDVLPDIGHLPPTAVTRQHILAILRKAESRALWSCCGGSACGSSRCMSSRSMRTWSPRHRSRRPTEKLHAADAGALLRDHECIGCRATDAGHPRLRPHDRADCAAALGALVSAAE